MGKLYPHVWIDGEDVIAGIGRPDYPDPAHIPDEIKFGHTRFAEAPDSQHNWALRGTITEEQGRSMSPKAR